MTPEEHRRRMAELLAADIAERASAEAEIARKEAVLEAAMARLAETRAETARIEQELEIARREQSEAEDEPRLRVIEGGRSDE